METPIQTGANGGRKSVTPSSKAQESSPDLDLDALQNLLDMLGGEFASLDMLIESFLEDAPRQLDELDAALRNGDAVVVRRIAHSLKSNGADFGAVMFSNLCRDLEGIGKSGDLTGAEPLYGQLKTEYNKVKKVLESIRQQERITW